LEDAAAVVAVRSQLLAQLAGVSGVPVRHIDVDFARHSVQADAICEPLVKALADIEPRSASMPFFDGDW
jgi:acyl transferase domain-containing protein